MDGIQVRVYSLGLMIINNRLNVLSGNYETCESAAYPAGQTHPDISNGCARKRLYYIISLRTSMMMMMTVVVVVELNLVSSKFDLMDNCAVCTRKRFANCVGVFFVFVMMRIQIWMCQNFCKIQISLKDNSKNGHTITMLHLVFFKWKFDYEQNG